MKLVIRIVIGIIWVVFSFYYGEHNGKTIYKKNLTKEEKNYIDGLSISSYILSLVVVILMFCITE